MALMTFSEALRESQSYNRRHLLLGNGFSIACRPNIFAYGKLFEQADFSKISPTAKNAFAALGTQDFEKVIKALRDASKIIAAYGWPEATPRPWQQTQMAFANCLFRRSRQVIRRGPVNLTKPSTKPAGSSWRPLTRSTRSTTISCCTGCRCTLRKASAPHRTTGFVRPRMISSLATLFGNRDKAMNRTCGFYTGRFTSSTPVQRFRSTRGGTLASD